MINEIFSELKKCYGNSYYRKLNELEHLDINSNIIKNELLKLIDENINNNEIIIIIDIFLKLKYLNKFLEKDVVYLNKKIAFIFNTTKNEEVAYYLLGYVISNNLGYNENKFEQTFKIIDEEIILGNDISNLVKENNPYKEQAIIAWVGGHVSEELNINIFKVCDKIRENLNNDVDKRKLNDTLYGILNSCDKSIKGMDNILEFMIGIYQDKKFRCENVIKKMNIFIMRSKSTVLEKLYIDISKEYKIKRIEESYKYLESAARGVLIEKDSDILNDYLNKTIKNNKKISSIINLQYGYSANEIIKLANIDISKKIDLESLLKKLKIQYYETEDLSSTIAGYSFKLKKHNKGSIIMNNNYKCQNERRRFTLAHEIGHICSEIDGKNFSEDYIFKKTQYNKNEKISNIFASELLLPQQVVDDFNDIDLNYDRIEELAKKYEVSIEMACNRVVKAAKGSFIFIMDKGTEKYTISSNGYYGSEEKLERFKEEIDNITYNKRKQWYKEFNYTVDIEIKGSYKYIIVNDRYGKIR